LAASNSVQSLTVQASTAYLAKVRRFVAERARMFGFDEQQVSDIQLAVDEAFTNIIQHAYKNNAARTVQISLHYTGDTFRVSLTDTGRSFSLDEYERPDIKQRIRQKKRGGVGVYLIQKLMDEVTYRRNGRDNEICMLKRR
jgi:serine/threonine-protein kinase RsbW